jgi:hypothetical protein
MIGGGLPLQSEVTPRFVRNRQSTHARLIGNFESVLRELPEEVKMWPVSSLILRSYHHSNNTRSLSDDIRHHSSGVHKDLSSKCSLSRQA